jgi:hypothetical protein
VYFADKGQTQAALNITGRHVFKAEKSTTELAWETSIGFSGKSFLAQVDASSTTHFATGQVLAIKGDLTLQQDDGTPLKMNLSLEASYSFDANNMLVFKALITGGDQPSYDLMLQGKFHYQNLSLVFNVEYSQNPSASDIKVSLGITGDRNSIVKNIALVLDISEAEAKLQLNLSFDVRLRFADGVRVKEPLLGAAGMTAASGAGVGASAPAAHA